jgi:hypothetical protein
MWWGGINGIGGGGWMGGWWGWLMPLLVLDLVLRGFALWRSARRGQKWWFVALLIVNSVGILPGVYLLTHKGSPSREASEGQSSPASGGRKTSKRRGKGKK